MGMKILCEDCDFGISVAGVIVCEKTGVFYKVKKECKEVEESKEEIDRMFEEWKRYNEEKKKEKRNRFESWYENELMSWDKDKREDWLFERWKEWEEKVNWEMNPFNFMK